MPKNIILQSAIIAIMLSCVSLMAKTAYAQLEFLIDGYEDEYIDSDSGGLSAEKFNSDETGDTYNEYIYEIPSVKALSYMYWALDLYKTSDDNAVDKFMQINECDIYKKFSGDELEWGEIRDAAKIFIKENKAEFPTRFSFVLPLKLSDYSPRRQAFEIQDKYKVLPSRKFEFFAKDVHSKPCSIGASIASGYPRILNVEFSRPFSLVRIPMNPVMANKYIKKTTKTYHSWYEERLRTKELLYAFRKVFLVMNIKIFAYGKHLPLGRGRLPTVQMMGILESYSLYGDKELTNLFYKHSYVSNRKKGKLNIRLKDQYEILREKSKADGMLH